MIGGLLVDRSAQGQGVGRAATESLIRWLSELGHQAIRLSYQPGNLGAARLDETLGFRPTGAMEDAELVAERRSEF